MIVLFDTNFLAILFDPRARVPIDKQTKEPIIDKAQERIDCLVQDISDKRGKIVLPTPALAEFMLLASDVYDQYLTIIRRKAVFEIAGFDDIEAVELVRLWSKHGKKKLRRSGPDTWAKLKYDRQIIAIGQTHRVDVIYSTDNDLSRLAKQAEIEFRSLADLPTLPPEQLNLKEREDDTDPKAERGDQAQPQPQPADLPGSGGGPPEGQATAETEAGEGGKEEAPS